MKKYAVILFSGDSTRFGSETPKQFYEVDGKPLIYYTIKSFVDSPLIDGIVLVTKKEYIDKVAKYLFDWKFTKVIGIAGGGKTRQESSFNGLMLLADDAKKDDIVLIHDGARPLVSKKVIGDLVLALKDHEGATVAMKSTDTMVLVDTLNQEMVGVLNRDEVYRVQTPQAFRFGTIFEAHQLYKDKNVTDDTQLLQGVFPIKIVPGDEKLIKITTLGDIQYLKLLLGKEND